VPLLTRKTQVAIKNESTEGTVNTPVAADAAFNIFETGFTADIEQFERNPFRASVGSRASIAGVKTGSITYTTELAGSGSATTAPPFGPALQSCGFAKATCDLMAGGTVTGTFVVGETITGAGAFSETVLAVDGDNIYISTGASNPGTAAIVGATSEAEMALTGRTISGPVGFVYSTTSTYSTTSAPSSSVDLLNDGVRHRIIGARGNVTLRASTGQPVQAMFEFTGPKVATANGPLLNGVAYPTTTPEPLLSALFSVGGGFAAVVDNIEVNTNNDLQVRRSMNTASGVVSTQIVNRQVQGSIDPEMTVVTGTGNHDWFGRLDANTEGLMKFTVGSDVGNKFKIMAPQAQYTGVSPGDRNGIATVSIDLAMNESTLGDDDLQIVCL